jgi:hypothetical protein
MKARLSIVLLLFVAITPAYAAHVWTIGGLATSPADACTNTVWVGGTAFFNPTDQPAVVTLVRQSNTAEQPAAPAQFTIEPHRGATLQQQSLVNNFPAFPKNTPLYINELDVPDGVMIEGRLEITASTCDASVHIVEPVNGKAETPVFRSLAAPGTIQRHLGTDLAGLPPRANVGVYNAGAVRANAHVEMRRIDDDAVVRQADVQVEPNSVVQVTIPFSPNTFADAPRQAPNPPQAGYWVFYTTVVVDQPSLSFVSLLATTQNKLGNWFVPYAIVQSTNQ